MTKSKRFMVFVPLVRFFTALWLSVMAQERAEKPSQKARTVERGAQRGQGQRSIDRLKWLHARRSNVRSSTAVALVAAAITPVHAQMGNGRCENIQGNAAADRVEKIYNGFAIGTDAENEGYPAA